MPNNDLVEKANLQLCSKLISEDIMQNTKEWALPNKVGRIVQQRDKMRILSRSDQERASCRRETCRIYVGKHC